MRRAILIVTLVLALAAAGVRTWQQRRAAEARRQAVESCESNRKLAAVVLTLELEDCRAAAGFDMKALIVSQAEKAPEGFRCPVCLSPYVFNPDVAAWLESEDPKTVLVVCPGPHYGRPETVLFGTSRGVGPTVEIPRDSPPEWYEHGASVARKIGGID